MASNSCVYAAEHVQHEEGGEGKTVWLHFMEKNDNSANCNVCEIICSSKGATPVITH